MWQTDEAMEINGKVLQHTTKGCTNPTDFLQSLFHIGRGLCPTISVTKTGADYLIKTSCPGSTPATKGIVLTPQGDSAYKEVSIDTLGTAKSKVTTIAKRVGDC